MQQEPKAQESEPASANDVAYAEAARDASRARLMLNFLVILSAAASSVFLVYVLTRVLPRNGGDAANVDVPTSVAQAKVGVLRGQSTETAREVAFELRDLDEAPGYRDKYSEKLREALGIERPGRLYQLTVRNLSKSEPLVFNGGTLRLRDKAGREHTALWLASVAQAERATALGRMTLAQSESVFTLAVGERRDLLVFVESGGEMPPAAEEMVNGTLEGGSLKKVNLERAEVTIGR
ncbi:hypothetical protein EDM80_14615 [bacterium]|nr:MAG: hypothetical protein EDM80_14615 [bacterium]RIK63851.1 MAG: hypothetical protein DCC64_05440 [Planctomycetota bacterium]